MRSHVCVVQCHSELGWPVIRDGKLSWGPDTQQGSIGVFWFSAVWYAPEGKRGLERPGLKLAKSDAVVLSGRNPFNTEWAEASCGEMLEHRARAQPSQVVAVVPTDFDCNAWKDLNDISRGAVCFTVSWHGGELQKSISTATRNTQNFATAATKPCNIFTTRCRREHHRRAAGVVTGCPTPKRGGRSLRGCFTEDITDSEGEKSVVDRLQWFGRRRNCERGDSAEGGAQFHPSRLILGKCSATHGQVHDRQGEDLRAPGRQHH